MHLWHRMEGRDGSEMPFLGIQSVPGLFGIYITENKVSHNCAHQWRTYRVFTICISPNLSYITRWEGVCSRALAGSLLNLSCLTVMAYFDMLQDIS